MEVLLSKAGATAGVLAVNWENQSIRMERAFNRWKTRGRTGREMPNYFLLMPHSLILLSSVL